MNLGTLTEAAERLGFHKDQLYVYRSRREDFPKHKWKSGHPTRRNIALYDLDEIEAWWVARDIYHSCNLST